MRGWRQTLDVSDVFRGEASFANRRDVMVQRVRALEPFDSDLQSLADDLAETEDVNEWDAAWDSFYDWADFNRVWVKTR